MLSVSGHEATSVLPDGDALPGQTALLFRVWLDKENVGMLGCDLGVSSELAAGKYAHQLYMTATDPDTTVLNCMCDSARGLCDQKSSCRGGGGLSTRLFCTHATYMQV